MTKSTIQLNLAESYPINLLNELREGLAKKTTELTLELVGPGCLMADTALMLYAELINRRKGLVLHTHACSCLLNGAVLLWLAGDRRSIRSDAWIQIDAATSRESDDLIYSCEESPADTDHRIITRHLDMYLPLEDIVDRRIFEPELRELGLIDEPESERILSQFFGGECPPPHLYSRNGAL